MLAIFEKCSSTSEEDKSPVKPLEFVASCERIYHAVLKDAEEKEYYGLTSKKEFYEIYYWYLGFEVSISITQSTKSTRSYLNMMVYGENKRGKTRKMLKHLLEYYKDLLKDLIV